MQIEFSEWLALEEEYWINIVIFICNDAVIVPMDSMETMVGDTIIYRTLDLDS